MAKIPSRWSPSLANTACSNSTMEAIKSTCGIGWRVRGAAAGGGGGLRVLETRPADFAAFWAKGKAALAAVPLQPEQGELKKFQGKEIDAYNLASAALPGDYDPTGHKTEVVEAGKVSFASVKGLRVHGWLAKPVGPGPFPAMLVLPGGGISSRPMPLEHARHGYLALDIQIHGHEVDLKEYPKVPGYYNDGHEVFSPPEDNYWWKVYLNAWQAVNYLASRPDVDPKRIVVVGGSQGGRLSVVLAGLDTRIAAALPAIAHFGNIAYWRWAEQLNKAKQTGMDQEIPPVPANITPEERCMSYYDIMNFAPDVKCPVLMNMGLVDPVSMPTGVWATYERLGTADKKMVVLPGMGHDWSSEFDRQAWRWLEEKLGK
ncbi:MAG: acetylxylan esterase [Phycisphaerae bacterium]